MPQNKHNFHRLRSVSALLAIACAVEQGSGELRVTGSPAAKVVIVRSKELEPFKQAEAAFIAALGTGTQTVALSLAEATPEALATAAKDEQTAFFAIGTEAATNVKKAAGPANGLVCAMVSDPMSIGVFENRRTAAVTMETAPAEQVKLISSALPTVRKIAVLYRGDTPKGKRAVEEMRAALPKGWSLTAVEVGSKPSVSDAVDAMLSGEPDLIWTYPDFALYDVATIKNVLLESLRKKVPVFGFSAAFVRAGAVIGVGTTPADQGRQAASALAQKSGTGGDGDDVVEYADTRTYVNTVVADRLGITLPAAVTQSAATVFKGE